jgi:hypothetical protein
MTTKLGISLPDDLVSAARTGVAWRYPSSAAGSILRLEVVAVVPLDEPEARRQGPVRSGEDC